jgi:hypothetical protein
LKKRTKKLFLCSRCILVPPVSANKTKVSCFFFSKKKYFLPSPCPLEIAVNPVQAAHAQEGGAWRDALRRG